MAALPADFPKPPIRPPATEPFGTKAWVDYIADLDAWLNKVLTTLKTG